jgi:flagellar biosynthesis/type III secretory pathway protein FliH
VFRRILEIARISNFNVEELMDYESDMKRFSDHANALAYAKKKGILQGEARGVSIGREEGVAIGLERGKSEIAQNMLGEGVEPALVARYTKLPLKAVKALR